MDLTDRHFILERSYLGHGICGYAYDVRGQLVDSVTIELENEEKVLPSQEVVKQAAKTCQEKGKPTILTEEKVIYYFAIKDDQDNIFLFGPIAMESLPLAKMQEYRHEHGIKSKKYKMPVIPPMKILNYIATMTFMLVGEQYEEKELLQLFGEITTVREQDYDIYEYSRDYEDRQRMAYQVEQQWTTAVENGTFRREQVELTEENLAKLDQIGTLAKGNSLKQLEYMVITTICLASRAAIRGGMNPYEAYTLSDLYYQKVAEASTIFELIQIYLMVANDFSDHVREVKNEHFHGGYTEQCKEYIARNRNKKISIEAMAKEFGINRSYLSRVFSKETGQTISEYIMEKRLQAAANMLKYSDVTISEISDYLCFNSQSYFGERFRKMYDCTPLEYRRNSQIHDFSNYKNDKKSQKQ